MILGTGVPDDTEGDQLCHPSFSHSSGKISLFWNLNSVPNDADASALVSRPVGLLVKLRMELRKPGIALEEIPVGTVKVAKRFAATIIQLFW